MPNFPKLLSAALLLALLFVPAAAQGQPEKPARPMPGRLGDFRLESPKGARPSRQFRPEDFAVTSDKEQNYVAQDGRNFYVRTVKTRSSSAAYSLLNFFAGAENPSRVGAVEGLGVLGINEPSRLRFIKGATFIDIQDVGDEPKAAHSLRAFAGMLAETLEGEAGDLPVLVMHLPEWEKKVNERIGYAVTLPALQALVGNRPVLDVLSADFEDGTTEAVTAEYGSGRLVVVEFATPQHSVESDARVNERIAQLRAAGQPVPTQYRRVGNYSVFVFDAKDEEAAEQLVAGVKYEKDVRWLGRNPHAEEIASRHITTTMGGVILNTLIASGLAILLCLGVGGLVGGAIFLHRRAQTTAHEAYSDAGGMLRLDLEDLNAPRAPSKLLGRAKD